jgi:hypothetical protein
MTLICTADNGLYTSSARTSTPRPANLRLARPIRRELRKKSWIH